MHLCKSNALINNFHTNVWSANDKCMLIYMKKWQTFCFFSAEAVRIYDAIRNFAHQAWLQAPDRITSTNLRKYMATIIQVFIRFHYWCLHSVIIIIIRWLSGKLWYLQHNCVGDQTPGKLLKFYRTVGPVKAHLLLVLLKFYWTKQTKWQQDAEIFFGQ